MSQGTGRRSRAGGRIPSWALAVAGVVVIGGILVAGYLVGTANRAGAGDPETVSFADMAVGDCLDVRVEGVPPHEVANDEAVREAVVLGDARRVACTEPHSHEVAEINGYEIGDAYVGDELLIRMAGPACGAGFRSYVGREAEGSLFGLVIVPPNATVWQAGSQRALCLVRRNDGTYATQRIRGSAQ